MSDRLQPHKEAALAWGKRSELNFRVAQSAERGSLETSLGTGCASKTRALLSGAAENQGNPGFASVPTLGTGKANRVMSGDCNCTLANETMNETMPESHDRLLAALATIPAYQRSHDGADWFPLVDIVEEPEEYLFKIELPEVRPENLQVAVEEDRLVISGERPNPWQGASKPLRVERPYGYFVRRFELPEDANRGEIHTLFADCVLEIRVRKAGSQIQPPAPTNGPPRLRLRSVHP